MRRGGERMMNGGCGAGPRCVAVQQVRTKADGMICDDGRHTIQGRRERDRNTCGIVARGTFLCKIHCYGQGPRGHGNREIHP